MNAVVHQLQHLLPVSLMDRVKQFFVYTMEWNTLAASEKESQSVNVDNDAYFLLTGLALKVTDAAGTTETTGLLPVLARLSDTGSGKSFHTGQIPLQNLTTRLADGGGITPLAFPRLVEPASTVEVELENLSGATAYRIFLALHGCKIFHKQSLGR